MRIANSMIARNYTNNLNSSLSRLNAYNMRVTTQRRFSSMAEDTASGVRAMKVRRTLAQTTVYKETAQMLNGKLSAAETNLMQMSALSREVIGEFVSGISEEKGPAEREVIAENLRKVRDSMLGIMNAQYSDLYLFGGTRTTERPFTLDTAGDLLYNGTSIKDMTPAEYDAFVKDAAHVDLGLGLTMSGQDIQGNSAFKSTMSGVEVFGHGENNIYIKLSQMIDALENNTSIVDSGKLLDEFKDIAADVNVQLTQLGANTQYLDTTIDRLDTESISLKERQNTIEIIDPAEAIMDFKMQEYVYNAALQMGNRLLQPTLFSFLN